MKRRVMTYKRHIDSDEFSRYTDGEGMFLEFGTGPQWWTNFVSSTAIVEMPDGNIKNLDLRLIKFLDVDNKEEAK